MKQTSPFVKLTLALLVFCTLLYVLRLVTEIPDATVSETSSNVIHGRTMGTTYTVTLVDLADSHQLTSIEQAIEQRLQTINQLMSTYITNSEISTFNQSQSTSWIPVSREFADLVQVAQSISERTNGALDITVGPAVNLWNFGPQPKPATAVALPTQDEIQDVLAHIGYQHLHVRDEPPALRKDDPELVIDLSAIAKGYAVDQIAILLESLQSPLEYMVEIGGEIKTSSHGTNGRRWRIGIQDPGNLNGIPAHIVNLSNHAIATSGDYINYYEIQGVRYSHTINPRTAKPVTHDLASAAVVMDSCASADAWATALLVLGPQAAYDLSNELGIAVILFTRSDSQLVSQMTRPMQNLIASKGTPE